MDKASYSDIFKHKKVFIAPFSQLTIRLKEILLKHIEFVGFIDKNEINKDIYKIEDIHRIEFDFILILSPNHCYAIYDEYLKHVTLEKLIHVQITPENYSYTIYSKKPTSRTFYYQPNEIKMQRKKLVFISKDFISSNNKFLFLYCQKQNQQCVMLSNNKKQLKEFKKFGFNAHLLETKEADYEIATAKFIIFDQDNYGYLPTLSRDQITIQQWHGVGLKKMQLQTQLAYDYFVSTSDWTNNTNFSHIFSSKYFLNYGYARNDILLKENIDKQDLILCDKAIYNKIIAKNKKIALYMPTYRKNQKLLPFDLDEMDLKLKTINCILILKLHPFMLAYYKHNLNSKYENILIHNTHGDIYPLLKYVDVLISDYSSIVYDFLLLNKKIIFYAYDKKEYNKTIKFLFDYDEFSPGVQVQTLEELIWQIANEEDNFKDKRAKILKLFFDFNDGNSSKRIYENIILKELK